MLLMIDLINNLQKELPENYDLQQVVDIGMYKIKKEISLAKDDDLKAQLKKLLQIKQTLEKYKKFSIKYKQVMFFERKKCKKIYEKASKSNADPDEVLKSKIDYIYTLQFPMDRKYISLLKDANNNSAKLEIYNAISERTRSGELSTNVVYKPFKTPARILKRQVKGIDQEEEPVEVPEADEFFNSIQ
eukprot:NODE_34_length_31639_cov_0.254375.p14 type:complete len:188 gc:universal NODE_34_length_31639_cov_0.254375:30239-29676(-)